MSVSVRFDFPAVIVTPTPALDKSTSEFIRRFFKRLKSASYTHVLFNLSHVSSIDRSGLGLLFMVAHNLRQRGGHTSLVDPPSAIRDALERADIPSLAPIFRREEDALKAA